MENCNSVVITESVLKVSLGEALAEEQYPAEQGTEESRGPALTRRSTGSVDLGLSRISAVLLSTERTAARVSRSVVGAVSHVAQCHWQLSLEELFPSSDFSFPTSPSTLVVDLAVCHGHVTWLSELIPRGSARVTG